MKESFQYTDQDIEILNSLAIIYCEQKKWSEGKKNFEKAIEIYKQNMFITNSSIYIRLCYNLSKLLYNLKEYRQGVSMCDKGIEICQQKDSNYLFGELLYQKGILLMEIDKREDGIEYLKNACIIFKLLKKHDYFHSVNEEINKLKSENKMLSTY